MNDLPNLSLFDLLNIQCLTAVAHPQQVWYTSSYKANTSAIKLKVCFFILCQKKIGKKKISWNSQITCKFQPPATYTLFELYHCKRQRTTEKSSRRQLPATLWQVQQLPVSVYCSGALGTVEWRCLCRTQGQRLHFGPDELLHSF